MSMNFGAFIYEPALLNQIEIEAATQLATELYDKKSSVHDGGRYAGLEWFQADLDPNWPIARKLLNHLGAQSPELLVFYYLEPDAYIHPHRDLTGATLNDRLRFHIPIITNSDVDFRVSKERVQMQPGDLWCLDTSYLHSVHNKGSATRVHIVIECAITPQIRLNIPHGIKAKLHSIAYVIILTSSLGKALAINIFKDRDYLRAQLGMIVKYVRWRFLGIDRAK
jgi:Aspartyl/Asparaginyl beta-hydroxylase